MNHIFFLHSNICTIVAFNTIKGLIEKEEKVVVILNRGTKFPFFVEKVKTFDIQYITDEYRKSSSNIIGKFLNYRFCLIVLHVCSDFLRWEFFPDFCWIYFSCCSILFY